MSAARLVALVSLVLLAAAACAPPSPPPDAGQRAAGTSAASDGSSLPRRVTIAGQAGQTRGLLFGRGDYGVVLAHGAIYDAASWTPLAVEIARAGMVALAVEEIGPDNLLDAIAYLKEAEGARAVALVGASAGGASALRAVERAPDAVDQLILLSARGDVARTGTVPKLFVVSEGEPLAEDVRRMAAEAPGDDNELLILPGSAHAQAIFLTDQGPRLTEAILARLQERAGAPQAPRREP